MRQLLLFVLMVVALFGSDELDDYYKGSTGQKIKSNAYPISILSSNCKCQHYINEAFIQHVENDMTAQLYQMNIDQRNLAKHFLGDEMQKGLENELLGINAVYNQSFSDLTMLDEMIFLTEKLGKQGELVGKSNRLIIKNNIRQDEKKR